MAGTVNEESSLERSETTAADAHCFSECDCSCRDQLGAFNKTVFEETKIEVTLQELTHSNISWYTDRSMDDSGLSGMLINEPYGVYILWHKNDYCNVHDRFHMKALYAGKGNPKRRLTHHWETKNTADEMLIYFSFFPCRNRISKYLEQLLLDTYDFPMNRSENKGKLTLCAYFSQGEVD